MSNSAAHCLGDTARYIYIYFSCCFGTTGNFNHRRKKPPPPPPCATVWPTLPLSISLSLSPTLASCYGSSCSLSTLSSMSSFAINERFMTTHTTAHPHTRTHTHTPAHPQRHPDRLWQRRAAFFFMSHHYFYYDAAGGGIGYGIGEACYSRVISD